jgi:hypothetical protein
VAPNLATVPGLQHATVFIGFPGDIDGDGAVGGSDLAVLLADWSRSTAAAGYLASDLSGDGVVDAADLSVLLARWGQ